MKQTQTDLHSNYDPVAENYAGHYGDELARKPFDRAMLDVLAEKVGGLGVVCDLGCGPGQVARYLHGRGVEACGVDLSPEMVKQAQRLNPDIPFRQGNMLSLTEVSDNTYGGVAAFYSIIHIPRALVVEALRELGRTLRRQGTLLLAFHIGRDVERLDEWWGKKVSLEFTLFETEEMKNYLKAAGFELEETIEREPYPELEVPTRRAYIFARKV